jgi:hypothetical protein
MFLNLFVDIKISCISMPRKGKKMEASHRHYVTVETVKSIIVNTILGTIAVLIASNGKLLIPLMEAGGVLTNLIPQTFMTVFMSVLVATIVTRKQRRAGNISGIKKDVVVHSTHVLVRSAISGLLALAVIIPSFYLLLPIITPALWQKSILIVFTMGYAIVLSVIVTPIALVRTLSEDIQDVKNVKEDLAIN